MENIDKIYAIILDRNQGGHGEGGNCKVVAFCRGNEYINDDKIISKVFETDSKIFSDKIFKFLPDAKINQLIEIVTTGINTEIERGRNYYVFLKDIKKIGNLIIDVPSDYLNNGYINLEELNNYFEINGFLHFDLGNFYICDNEKIYGPFKINAKKIQPTKDKFVHSFEYDINDLIEVDNYEFSYLIEEPKNKLDLVDCMTVSQLMDFLKDNLSIDRAEINSIKKTYDKINSINNGKFNLDKIRLERASSYLSQLILTYEELKNISSKENEWNLIIINIINKYREKFKEDSLNEILDKIQLKNAINEDLQKQIELKQIEFNKLELDCKKSKNEFEEINIKKDDLILSIQIAAGINNGSAKKLNNDDANYSEIILSQNPSVFFELDDFYDQLNKNITSKEILRNTIYILKEKKFIIGDSIELIINAIQHLGTYKIMIQNAEADWLKYKYLKENGLDFFCESSIVNKEIPHFFILQDFNIASFECYGKPILDVANGIRNKIPGNANDWPQNLFFIIITADSNIDNFGFKLNKSTFKNWSFFPPTEEYIYQQIQCNEGINLSNLLVYSQYPDYSENYF